MGSGQSAASLAIIVHKYPSVCLCIVVTARGGHGDRRAATRTPDSHAGYLKALAQGNVAQKRDSLVNKCILWSTVALICRRCHTMAGDIYSSIEGGLPWTNIGANSKMAIPLNLQLLF